jgi:anti-sigma regulatory factor (Ser/Thr protein kinase)
MTQRQQRVRFHGHDAPKRGDRGEPLFWSTHPPAMPTTSIDTEEPMRLHAAPPASAGLASSAGFRHEALLYGGDNDFLEGTLRFLREGVAREEPAMVVVAPHKIALLRAALGADAQQVRFEDMGRVGANPARIIPAWTEFVREAGGAERTLRGIGEPISAERSGGELFECHRHESLLNLAFAHAADFHLLCPYDVDMLDPAVVAHARCTHPLVQDVEGHVHRSTAFHGLAAAAEPCRAPLPQPPVDAQEIPVMPAGLTAMRALVARRAQRAGLTPQQREDLVLAINELATNSIRHGGGAGMLTIWETRATLVCEVTDLGCLIDPLAGRILPEPGQVGRYGLWLVNQLCDLVEQRTLPRGNLVRVSMVRA